MFKGKGAGKENMLVLITAELHQLIADEGGPLLFML
jgi:hypothetical protein